MLQFRFNLQKVIFKIIQKNEAFTNPDIIPLLLVASADKSGSSANKEDAQAYLNSLKLDTDDMELSGLCYDLVFGEFDVYFHLPQETVELIGPAPFPTQ